MTKLWNSTTHLFSIVIKLFNCIKLQPIIVCKLLVVTSLLLVLLDHICVSLIKRICLYLLGKVLGQNMTIKVVGLTTTLISHICALLLIKDC